MLRKTIYLDDAVNSNFFDRNVVSLHSRSLFFDSFNVEKSCIFVFD